MKVAFVHPDLGIGGAERVVVDAAVGLQKKGHNVTIFTSHHDPKHAFVETTNGTLKVKVYGDFLPRGLFGGFYILFAILRNLYLSFALLFSGEKFDAIFCDQISFSIPILKLSGAKILFYCHFPDKLLSKRTSVWKTLYRMPVDFFEELTTGAAHEIVVNSEFTRTTFKKAFPSIKAVPSILYPALNLESHDLVRELSLESPFRSYLQNPKKIILSINRFERKKNIDLAVRAFVELRNTLEQAEFEELQLVIAGGYDIRVMENVEHLNELCALVTSFHLTYEIVSSSSEKKFSQLQKFNVIFLPSFSEAQRNFLFSQAFCLLYTPTNEHFGIVPCESMYAQLPVIAVNNGGPTESILHGETGLLLESSPKAFSAGIKTLLSGEIDPKAMGRKGRERVKRLFSLDAFTNRLEEILLELVESKKGK